MKWLFGLAAGSLVFLLLIMAPIIGYLTQPWAPWWTSNGAPQTLIVGGDSVAADVGNLQLGAGPAPQVPIADAAAPPQAGILGLLLSIVQPWMGDPYVFGGCSMTRGADCSCFVQITAARLGVSLPRTAQLQWNVTDRTSNPQPGDLVFFTRTYDSPDFITHVGWYIGGNQMISEAEPAVARQSLDSPYWRAHLAGFGRLRGLPSPGQA